MEKMKREIRKEYLTYQSGGPCLVNSIVDNVSGLDNLVNTLIIWFPYCRSMLCSNTVNFSSQLLCFPPECFSRHTFGQDVSNIWKGGEVVDLSNPMDQYLVQYVTVLLEDIHRQDHHGQHQGDRLAGYVGHADHHSLHLHGYWSSGVWQVSSCNWILTRWSFYHTCVYDTKKSLDHTCILRSCCDNIASGCNNDTIEFTLIK